MKLTTANYLLWKTQIESFLLSQQLLGHVTGSTPRPSATVTVKIGDNLCEESNPEFVKWLHADQLVMAWLFGSLSEDALRVVYGLQSAQEVWFSLSKSFNRVFVAYKYDLQRRLQTISKQVKTIVDYLNTSNIYESISAVLESSMDSFPLPSYDDVVVRVISFDEKKQNYNSFQEPPPHLAFNTERGYQPRSRGDYRRFRGFRGLSAYSTRERGFPQQINTGFDKRTTNDWNSRPSCQICGKYGHVAERCYKHFDHAYNVDDVQTALTTLKVTDQSIDGGH